MDETIGLAWIIVGWILVLGAAIIALLELGNIKETNPLIGFVVFLGWAGPFSILYFLPIDLTSSKYRQCLTAHPTEPNHCTPPFLYISASVLTIIWQSIYWTLFCLTWAAIPILQSFCDCGGFTTMQSLRKALKYNAWYYGTIGIIALVALAYSTVVNGPPNFLALKSVGMALSNAYGLILLVLCLSYGLVDVPRELWLAADIHRSLAILEVRAPRYRTNLQNATRDLEGIYNEISLLNGMVQVSDNVRPFVDMLLLKCPEQHRAAINAQRSGGFSFSSWFSRGSSRITLQPSSGSSNVSVKSLQDLHRRLKRTRLRRDQSQFQWNKLLDSALFMQDIVDNQDNTDRQFHVLGRFVPRWKQRLEYLWYNILRATTLRILAIICGLMSIGLLWSEVTMNMGLSLLALVTMTQSYTILQAVCLTAMGFMTVCTFVPLLSLRVFSIHQLAPNHHSSISSLLFFAAQMTRFTFPMSWNFANLTETSSLVFSKVMGTVNLVPLLGESFNDWVPISLVILCSMTLLNVQGRIFKCLNLDTSYVATDDDNESGIADRQDGRLLLQQARAQRIQEASAISAVPLVDDRQGLLANPITTSPVGTSQPLLPDDAFVPLAKRRVVGSKRMPNQFSVGRSSSSSPPVSKPVSVPTKIDERLPLYAVSETGSSLPMFRSNNVPKLDYSPLGDKKSGSGIPNVIHTGFNITHHIANDIISLIGKSRIAFITDSNLANLHLTTLMNAVKHAWSNANPHTMMEKDHIISFILPPGESTKSRYTKAVIEDWLLSHHCTRDTVLIAFGGGVVGDLVGYVSATYMRGCSLIQIPTTLLAMVDSAIGGKTAIDVNAGKNLIGAFHQPLRIYIDHAYLATLPLREIKNGMAEIIKTAAFGSHELFLVLERDPENVLQCMSRRSSESDIVSRIILETARMKSEIVSADEKESGLRGLLNFGHTIGHAFEASLTPFLLHGECVSIGMVLEAEISRHLGHLNQSDLGRLVRVISNYGLPTFIHDPLVTSYLQHSHIQARVPISDLLDFMKVDKKNSGTEKKMVLLSRMGATVDRHASAVPENIIRLIIAPGICVHPISPMLSQLPDPDITPIKVIVPGSKSISNRALLLAALAKGSTSIHNLLHSDDTQVMLTALQRLGACSYIWEDNALIVHGHGGKFSPLPDVESTPIYLGNAGTAARFLTCAISLVQSHSNITITGNSRMQQRPILPLVEALLSNGIPIKCSSTGCLPVNFNASESTGFPGGHIRLSASISSQYVSAILMCAPYAKTRVTLELIGDKVISESYIDLTIAMMKTFGVHVEKQSSNLYIIPQSAYTPPSSNQYIVEPDASSATYPLALAALTGRAVTVPNLGSNSLQGDARFAIDILGPMGCVVTQSHSETTVLGPPIGTLRALGNIDMEHLTDAFLTASVLAAVATRPNKNGSTQTVISGIANQRVKECNRIQAMRNELGKFGVQTDEHSDGLSITGRAWNSLQGNVHVFCYDDHRVAMSFSVLGALVGSCIEERKCVEKTWPAWWDTLSTVLGVTISDYEPSAPGCTLTKKKIESTRSIVLIGMRGVGKTTLGRALAQSLNRAFIDLDEEFILRQNGQSIGDWVASQPGGWSAFRTVETALVKELVTANLTGTIIACGGGVVETPECRTFFRSLTNVNVVHIRRSISCLLSEPQLLSRPSLGEDNESVWARRCPWYEYCAPIEFFVATNADGRYNWNQITHEFIGFIAGNLSGISSRTFALNKLDLMSGESRKMSATASPVSSFVSLTLPTLSETDFDQIQLVSEGVNAIEWRVDLLQDSSLESVARQFFTLRRMTRLPIIFTVRTESQAGAWPDNKIDSAMGLIEAAIRWGSDAVDLEIVWPSDELIRIQKLARERGVLTIASYHDHQGIHPWTETVYWAQQLYHAASLGDIVKLVGYACDAKENLDLQTFVLTLARDLLGKRVPLIAINMGEAGKLSRVLNTFLTPVTHASIKSAAAGQISLQDVHRARSACGLISGPKKFYLLGDPILQSRSPAIHNAGFASLGLPFEYSLYSTQEVTPMLIDMICKDPGFGGCSVTIPMKEKVHTLVQELTPTASAVGAINTIWRRAGDGVLVGDNTDVDGIRAVIAKHPKVSEQPNGRTALILGAGGTARAATFALLSPKSLVTRIVVMNRTLSRAQALISDFSQIAQAQSVTLEAVVLSMPPLAHKICEWSIVVSTIPRDVQVQYKWPSESFANTEILVDLVYGEITPIMAAAYQYNPAMHIVPGIEVLLEQAYVQFERWTGLLAPRLTMRHAALQKNT